jgi:hypothetical protein
MYDAASDLVCDALRLGDRRMDMLHAVAELDLPDAWIAAGAVRNAVWDRLHGYAASTPLTDVDVIWFDPARADRALDADLEHRLAAHQPGVNWSVKNQARMHARNGDAPYRDCLDAMRAWPETATAIAARPGADGRIELAAAYGFGDLVSLLLRPTPRFAGSAAFYNRLAAKRWLDIWPNLRLAESAA